MATYLHFAPAVALAAVLGPQRVSFRLMAAGALCAVLLDLDFVMYSFKIAPYGDTYGHRGFTHSIGFALLLAVLAMALLRWHRAPRARVGWGGLFVLLATLSHPLIDGLLDVGICNAWLWPLDGARHCLPWRPIPMSGSALHGWARFVRECLWIGLPLVVVTQLAVWARGLLEAPSPPRYPAQLAQPARPTALPPMRCRYGRRGLLTA